MYEDLQGIKLSGEMTKSIDKKISLFKKEQNKPSSRMTIVYGKNGSGKSTIARGFQELICEDEILDSSIHSFEPYDYSENMIEVTESFKSSIHVFNEAFIDNNIKIEEDGLSTIVMFGKQVELENQINQLRSDIKDKENFFEQETEKFKEFNNHNSLTSPKYHMDQCMKILKGDSNWAGKDKEIKGNKANSSVNELLVHRLVKLKSSSKLSTLETQFATSMTEFKKLKNFGVKIITRPITEIDFFSDFTHIKSLLEEKIERPTLSDRDNKIMELILSGKQEQFIQVRNTFLNQAVSECPYCLQYISEEYKEALVNGIENVLGERVEAHKQQLKQVQIPLITIDFKLYNQLDSETIEKCKQKLEMVNKIYEKYNKLIDKKMENVYSPIIDENIDFDPIFNDLFRTLQQLEEEKNEFNNKLSQLDRYKQTLLDLNDQIYRYKIFDRYNAYLEQNEKKQESEKETKKLAREIEEKKEEIKKLEQQQNKTEIAVEFINNGLKYIFFSHERLQIV